MFPPGVCESLLPIQWVHVVLTFGCAQLDSLHQLQSYALTASEKFVHQFEKHSHLTLMRYF